MVKPLQPTGRGHSLASLLTFFAFLLSSISAQQLDLANCQSAAIVKPLRVVAHLEAPFVMRRRYNASLASNESLPADDALTRADLDGYSLDVLAVVSRRFGIDFTIKMLTANELKRWDNKRHLVENTMFSRRVDMSANVLTRRDNRRQNLPPLMSGSVKAVLKHYEGFQRMDNYTNLVALAQRDHSVALSAAAIRAAQPDAVWKFSAVENSDAWLACKRTRLIETQTLYHRMWDERRRRSLPVNRTDGLAKLAGSTGAMPYVFFDESIWADYYAALDDQLYTIDIEPIESIEYVFGSAFDMREDVKRNLACIFRELAEDGTLGRVKDKWFKV